MVLLPLLMANYMLVFVQSVWLVSSRLSRLLSLYGSNCGFQDPPDWSEILTYFRGSELQNYFTKILEDDLKAVIKPQYVDQIPKAVKVRGNTSYYLQCDDVCNVIRSKSGS